MSGCVTLQVSANGYLAIATTKGDCCINSLDMIDERGSKIQWWGKDSQGRCREISTTDPVQFNPHSEKAFELYGVRRLFAHLPGNSLVDGVTVKVDELRKTKWFLSPHKSLNINVPVKIVLPQDGFRKDSSYELELTCINRQFTGIFKSV